LHLTIFEQPEKKTFSAAFLLVKVANRGLSCVELAVKNKME
jgi:hypothetical protein